MIDKITVEELIEIVFEDQIDSLKDMDLSSKEKKEQKESLKEDILESETLEVLKTRLLKYGYREEEVGEYLLSFFVEE